MITAPGAAGGRLPEQSAASGLTEHCVMTISEFLARVEEHPRLSLVHQDGTICIIRYTGPNGSRDIRIGFWAVTERQWEQLLEALSIPAEVAVA